MGAERKEKPIDNKPKQKAELNYDQMRQKAKDDYRKHTKEQANVAFTSWRIRELEAKKTENKPPPERNAVENYKLALEKRPEHQDRDWLFAKTVVDSPYSKKLEHSLGHKRARLEAIERDRSRLGDQRQKRYSRLGGI